jgi:acetylornithine/N-succinyldiaminopimelate aminotransferase
VALAVLRELAGGVLEASRATAAHLREALAALALEGRVTEVRGRGMLLAVLLRGVDAAAVGAAARERGLLVNPIGTGVVRLAPPLTLTLSEADEAVARFAAAVRAAPALA